MKAYTGNLFKNPVHLFAFGFGAGLSPIAPGTVGTLLAAFFYYFLQHLPVPMYGLFLILVTVMGFYLCEITASELKVHDHPGIVWDEFVGYWITMLAAPSGWQWMLLGFVLFRLLDIIKPWPISYLDKKVKGGIGIMLDDIVAGVFALGILQAINIYCYDLIV